MSKVAGGEFTRRNFLKVGGASLVAASVTGCEFLSTEPEQERGDRGPAGDRPKGKEAPRLAELVERGELPQVEERLPKEPMVLEPVERIGNYGGDWNLIMLPTDPGGDRLNTTIGYEQLLRWKTDTTELVADQVIPNVAEGFEVGRDGAEYTFRLREGIRWSDGEPFTADDIVFWYEDVLMNEELTPVFPEELSVGDEPLVVEKADDYTVVFRFSAPNGLFVVNMATQRGLPPTSYPAHYLKRFHKKYSDDIEQQVEQANLDNWINLFLGKASLWENADLPVLNAWRLTSAFGEGSQRLVAERNPYYWKVDPDGSQLPYMDRVVFDIVNDTEAALLRALNGEVDMVGRGINALRDKPVYARNREKGDYHFFDTVPQQMNQMILMLNLTHKDETRREVFNKDFRIGLSHAINRQEIIDAVYQSQGEPWQAAPRPESPYYNERLAKQYTEYDVDLANESLDKVLPEKDSGGVRLGPGGEPFSFQVEVPSSFPDFVDVLELVRQYWREVGIDMRVKLEDDDLFSTRVDANEHDACVWVGGGGLGVLMDPFYYVPYNFNTRYAVPWSYWFQNPEDERAMEPPAETRKQIELYKQLLATADTQRQNELMGRIMEIAVDQFYCMGIALRAGEYGIFKNGLRNTPESSITGWLHAELMPNNPQQYFFKKQ
jgi:peptide/nickel transport system substrate-binding protein